MPHALTNRQKEYLHFLREYIRENEDTPALEEIAKQFKVKAPTAHKILTALQTKGYLIFRRDPDAGFFIRLAERVGMEKIIEILVIGRVDASGEVSDFPEKLGHFPVLLVGVNELEVFALEVTEDIPQAVMKAGDYLIFDYGKKPQPGDICIFPFGMNGKWLLCGIGSKTYDRDTPAFELAQTYPIPEALTKWELGQKLNWYPLAWDEDNQAYFENLAAQEIMPAVALDVDFTMATAVKLVRNYPAKEY